MITVLVEHGEVTKLSSIFKVSRKTVRHALMGITRTELAQRIREEAIRRGGVMRCYKRNTI